MQRTKVYNWEKRAQFIWGLCRLRAATIAHCMLPTIEIEQLDDDGGKKRVAKNEIAGQRSRMEIASISPCALGRACDAYRCAQVARCTVFVSNSPNWNNCELEIICLCFSMFLLGCCFLWVLLNATPTNIWMEIVCSLVVFVCVCRFICVCCPLLFVSALFLYARI